MSTFVSRNKESLDFDLFKVISFFKQNELAAKLRFYNLAEYNNGFNSWYMKVF